MNKEQELENRQLQNEEMEALEAIYPESFEKDTTTPDPAFIYTLNLDQDLDQDLIRSPRKVIVKFFLPPTYPNQDMPVYEVASIYCGNTKIDDAMVEAIDIGFQSLFQTGEVVLFEWISWLRDYLEENVERPNNKEGPLEDVTSSIANLELQKKEEEEQDDDAPELEAFDTKSDRIEEEEAHDRPTVRSLMGPNLYHSEAPPAIFTSEALLDRKSTFIAHVAEVHNVHEVKLVVSHLLQNKKIAKATHNILAYRITMPDGKILQDNDDDGESAAGGRLAHLMQILEVEDVVVVVTRWFGGIHLGPDRFKDINNVARKALGDCGFIKDKHTKNNTNSKSNKKNNQGNKK